MITSQDPFDDLYWGFKPPTSVPDLLTAMQSAAAYAELAVLAGSWEPNDIERRLYGREWNKTGNDKLRGTFRSPRDGGKIHASHVDKIRSLFPDSHLSWWQRHPIAQILCDASLGQDAVLDALNTLPKGPERQCVWNDYVGAFTWTPFVRELPDTADVIQRLAGMQTPFALLALIGRMRLAQLRGADGCIDVKYEKALLHMLPDCIAYSPQLFLGQEALQEAVWRFLWWSPHAEARFLMQLHETKPTLGDVESRLSAAVPLISWPGLPLPPADQLKSRRDSVAKIAQNLG